MESEDKMVRCELVKIMITETADPQVIVLKEADGERVFPILIGISEAIAIDRKIKGYEPARPLTHDLLASVISSLNAELQRVEVCALRENTFYARLLLSQNGETIEVDSRPSDGIALAVRVDAPIYVAEEVLDEVCP
ncbi:MAG: bifunctional nuclease family protein [bacterium]